MMETNHCQQLIAVISDYVDGELPEDACARLEAHLSECENCRCVVDTIRKTIEVYQQVEDCPPLPEDVRQRLYKHLELDDARPPSKDEKHVQ